MIQLVVVFVVAGLALVSSAVAQPARDDAASGRQLFFSQGCYGCHRIGPAGTPIAYDLTHIGRKYTRAELVLWLRDPSSQKPTAHMPRLALLEDEIQALAHYLSELK